MSIGKIYVLGLGPGDEGQITPAVTKVISKADTIIGYKYYMQFVEGLRRADSEVIDTGMRKERERAKVAFDCAQEGKLVAVISSGDAGIYGMAPLIWEMKRDINSEIEIEVLPGISAFQMAASRLGAPIGHDQCIISLSDLLTPWEKIEKRIIAAADADFVTSIYNPKSNGRYWQLHRLKELFLQYRSEDTPVGYVRQAGRDEEETYVTTLKDFDPEEIDMFTVVIIGNSQSYQFQNSFITPRGYYGEGNRKGKNVGQSIMIDSFRKIDSLLSNRDIALDKKWALLHCIHTTADFDMESVFYADDNAISLWNQLFNSGKPPVIISDVTMVTSGIRKAAIKRLGIEVKTYLHDDRVMELSKRLNITRTQAGIRLAVEEHPDAIYLFGNAPTALIELTDQMRKGKASPAGIVAAPVGFVNVQESKHRVKTFVSTPKVIIEGRKGGSNIAATIINAALAFEDAANLEPGREV